VKGSDCRHERHKVFHAFWRRGRALRVCSTQNALQRFAGVARAPAAVEDTSSNPALRKRQASDGRDDRIAHVPRQLPAGKDRRTMGSC